MEAISIIYNYDAYQYIVCYDTTHSNNPDTLFPSSYRSLVTYFDQTANTVYMTMCIMHTLLQCKLICDTPVKLHIRIKWSGDTSNPWGSWKQIY